MLGLALVAGSVGAVVAGAGYGIFAYYTSTKTTVKKLEELDRANQMIETLNSLDQSDQIDPALYLQRVTECSAQLKDFKTVNERTVAGGHDPDGGAMESGLMATLSAQLKTLEAA